MKEWEKKTERNLQYVAYTRPKKLLGFIKEGWGFRRKNPYSNSEMEKQISLLRELFGYTEIGAWHPFEAPKVNAEATVKPKEADIKKADSKKGGLKFCNLMKK